MENELLDKLSAKGQFIRAYSMIISKELTSEFSLECSLLSPRCPDQYFSKSVLFSAIALLKGFFEI